MTCTVEYGTALWSMSLRGGSVHADGGGCCAPTKIFLELQKIPKTFAVQEENGTFTEEIH
jgi:hypothetical protein